MRRVELSRPILVGALLASAVPAYSQRVVPVAGSAGQAPTVLAPLGATTAETLQRGEVPAPGALALGSLIHSAPSLAYPEQPQADAAPLTAAGQAVAAPLTAAGQAVAAPTLPESRPIEGVSAAQAPGGESEQSPQDVPDTRPVLREAAGLAAEEPAAQGARFDHSASVSKGADASAVAVPQPSAGQSPVRDATPLDAARAKLQEMLEGGEESNGVRFGRLSSFRRTEFFQSKEFKAWVAAEKAAGRRVFWLKDLDKTQAAGDIFTFFFKWRADNNKFTPQENEKMKAFLKTLRLTDPDLQSALARADQNDASENARLVLRLWRSKERGGEGIDLLQFWRDVYWPTQIGLTRKEKLAQVAEFAPWYAAKIYADVPWENLALAKAGVDVVLVSNGDQELARAVAKWLRIKPRNVIGSNLLYDRKGVSTGVNHSYEIFDKEWATKPQPGKALSFHYWLHANKWRWRWKDLRTDRIVIAGVDGDSASSDGGMMMQIQPVPVLGKFMVDTPHEPERVKKFQTMARRYGLDLERFFILEQFRMSQPAWDDLPGAR